MEQKLYENLKENEKVLWTGKPAFKALGDTHKKFYAAKVVVVLFLTTAFLMYYLMGVKEGTIVFKPAVIVLTAVVAAVPLTLEWLDAKKMSKTIYAITDTRIISIVDGAVHSVEYSKIKEYQFVDDADGQTSLVCGSDMMKKNSRSYRTGAVYGLSMNAENTACERFVLYAIPAADQVKKLIAERI